MTMPANFPLPLVLLVVVFAIAVAGGLYAIVTERQRRAVLRRATGTTGTSDLLTRRIAQRAPGSALLDWLAVRSPVQFGDNTALASKLVQAGFDGSTSAGLFGLIRIASAITIPLLALLVAPRESPMIFALSMMVAVIIGLVAPQAGLDRLRTQRQEVIRKGIPDALDVLVVCVEAGVALDSAVQRVARELSPVHPLLAEELVGMSRRMSAGMARDQAMQGLYLRTGLDELRGLASHMLQSERWGTSIAGVLRVYADQLRTKRQMVAEKRAATASTRMLLPLALFIFPTIFIVLLGPAAMQISNMFDQM